MFVTEPVGPPTYGFEVYSHGGGPLRSGWSAEENIFICSSANKFALLVTCGWYIDRDLDVPEDRLLLKRRPKVGSIFSIGHTQTPDPTDVNWKERKKKDKYAHQRHFDVADLTKINPPTEEDEGWKHYIWSGLLCGPKIDEDNMITAEPLYTWEQCIEGLEAAIKQWADNKWNDYYDRKEKEKTEQ